MTTSARVSVLVMIASCSVAVNAWARPYKVDIHPAICEKKRGGSLIYDGDRFVTASSQVDMVCPLPVATLPGDSGSASISFEAHFAGKAQTDLACLIEYRYGYGPDDNADWDVVWSAPFGASATSSTWTPPAGGFPGFGVVRGSPRLVSMPTPHLGDPPLQMSLHCVLEASAKLRMIQFIEEP
ncbi:MAG TPA: hypothetical protein VFH68_01410 [Polyangia bacterium]|nr:hypothetical protein [Polyangia bacterium]